MIPILKQYLSDRLYRAANGNEGTTYDRKDDTETPAAEELKPQVDMPLQGKGKSMCIKTLNNYSFLIFR